MIDDVEKSINERDKSVLAHSPRQPTGDKRGLCNWILSLWISLSVFCSLSYSYHVIMSCDVTAIGEYTEYCTMNCTVFIKMNYNVLHSNILYFTLLYGDVPYLIVRYCTILKFIILYYISSIIYYFVPYSILL